MNKSIVPFLIVLSVGCGKLNTTNRANNFSKISKKKILNIKNQNDDSKSEEKGGSDKIMELFINIAKNIVNNPDNPKYKDISVKALEKRIPNKEEFEFLVTRLKEFGFAEKIINGAKRLTYEGLTSNQMTELVKSAKKKCDNLTIETCQVYIFLIKIMKQIAAFPNMQKYKTLNINALKKKFTSESCKELLIRELENLGFKKSEKKEQWTYEKTILNQDLKFIEYIKAKKIPYIDITKTNIQYIIRNSYENIARFFKKIGSNLNYNNDSKEDEKNNDYDSKKDDEKSTDFDAISMGNQYWQEEFFLILNDMFVSINLNQDNETEIIAQAIHSSDCFNDSNNNSNFSNIINIMTLYEKDNLADIIYTLCKKKRDITTAINSFTNKKHNNPNIENIAMSLSKFITREINDPTIKDDSFCKILFIIFRQTLSMAQEINFCTNIMMNNWNAESNNDIMINNNNLKKLIYDFVSMFASTSEFRFNEKIVRDKIAQHYPMFNNNKFIERIFKFIQNELNIGWRKKFDDLLKNRTCIIKNKNINDFDIMYENFFFDKKLQAWRIMKFLKSNSKPFVNVFEYRINNPQHPLHPNNLAVNPLHPEYDRYHNSKLRHSLTTNKRRCRHLLRKNRRRNHFHRKNGGSVKYRDINSPIFEFIYLRK